MAHIAKHLYVLDGNVHTAVDVYCFNAGDVEVRVIGNTVHAGFTLPAHKARELGEFLIAAASTAESIAPKVSA